jgi:hypothetical protein
MFGHVMHSLDNPTPKRVATVVWTVMFVFLALGTSVGICGYLMFFQNVQSNILDNFGKDDPFGTFCRVLIITASSIGSPYAIFMVRFSCAPLLPAVCCAERRVPALCAPRAAPHCRDGRHSTEVARARN